MEYLELIGKITTEIHKRDKIDIEHVTSLLLDYKHSFERPTYKPAVPLKMACETFNTTIGEVLSKSRQRKNIYARAFFYLHMISLRVYTTTEIAISVNRTHATVLNGKKLMNDLLFSDKQLKLKWQIFQDKLETLTVKAA